MTETSAIPPVSTFVVRFWQEWSVAGSRWRGQVDHVQSGETTRFLDLEELLDILHSFGVMTRQAREADSISKYEKATPRAARPQSCKGEGSDRPGPAS